MRRLATVFLILCLLVPGALSEAAPEMPAVPELEPLGPQPVTVLISAAGDCTLGGEVKTGIDDRFAEVADKKGQDYFFEAVREIFSADDFTLVNLEGPLTDTSAKRASKTYVMRGDPAYTGILTSGSVEVANLANNHTLDFGQTGYQDTVEALTAAGIGFCNGDSVYIAEKEGFRIGFCGFERWHHSASDAVKGVKALREQCDLLIVSVHWGKEYHYKPESAQTKLGRALIDAGADLVIGTHPHVIQGIERYNGKYIVYSLGNFCFGGNTNPDDKNCYVFQQAFTLSEAGVEDGGIRVIPCSVSSSRSTNDYRPMPLTGENAEKLMDSLRSLSSLEGALWLDAIQ